MQFSLPLKCPFIKGVGWVSVPQLGRRNFFNLRDRLIIAYSLCENDKCSNILIYVQQDATPHSLFYLETALHVSGGTTTHHQERKQLYLQHLVFVTPLLQPAAIVDLQHLVFVTPLLLPACYLPLSWKSWNCFESAVGTDLFLF